MGVVPRGPVLSSIGIVFLLSVFIFPLFCLNGHADTPGAPESGLSTSEHEIQAVATLASGDLYALLVGVSKYGNATVPTLAMAAKDAEDFAGFLKSQRELFGKTNVRLLVNEQATKVALEKYLFYELKKAGKSDTIILFFSGHGAIDPKRPGEFFFLTHDADPEFLEATGLNMSELKFLKKIDCPRVVLIADACHAGGFSRAGTKAVVAPLKTLLKDFSSSSGRVTISSSRPDEYSLEKPRLQNSVFTHYFLEGLKGAADQDGNGVVTVNEAYQYAYNRTKAETEGAQHPQFDGVIEGIFPISLATKTMSGPVSTLELAVDPAGADVYVGGRLVGKTESDGSLFLKYLPLDRPVTVKLRKEGWLEMTVGPFVFSKDKLDFRPDPVKMKPALASIEVTTAPGQATVTIDGKKVGMTGSDGRLIVHGVQVSVSHTLEIVRSGYEDESLMICIPAKYEGKKFKGEPVKLAKKTPAPRAASEGTTSAPRQEFPVKAPAQRPEPSSPPGPGTSPGRTSDMGL